MQPIIEITLKERSRCPLYEELSTSVEPWCREGHVCNGAVFKECIIHNKDAAERVFKEWMDET